MAKKQQSKFKDALREVIEKNYLEEDPEGLKPMKQAEKDLDRIKPAKVMPEYRYITFLNGRDPGQELMFHYCSATHPLKHYTLFHGKQYDLPVEIVEHLESCRETQYGHRMNPNSGLSETYPKGYKYIFQCRQTKKAA